MECVCDVSVQVADNPDDKGAVVELEVGVATMYGALLVGVGTTLARVGVAFVGAEQAPVK